MKTDKPASAGRDAVPSVGELPDDLRIPLPASAGRPSVDPCPWCGIVPEIINHEDDSTTALLCMNSNCPVQPQGFSVSYEDRQQAFDAWNQHGDLLAVIKLALAANESQPECCNKPQTVMGRNGPEQECCGCPDYGFERCADILRAAIAKASPTTKGK